MSESASGGVRSVERAFSILEAMADAGGSMGVTEIAAKLALPVPTIHRGLATLVSLGYVKRGETHRYVLGSSLLYLGDAASRGIASWARPKLIALANECGETVNLAALEGDEIVYIAQAPSKHSMRMFTEMGRRVMPHACGVGKAILANISHDEAHQIIEQTGMPYYTETTHVSWESLLEDMKRIRESGFAIDEGEKEIGVRCIAAPILGTKPQSALSISGPEARVDDAFIARYSPLLIKVAADLSREFARTYGTKLRKR